MADHVETELIRVIAKHCSPEFTQPLTLETTLEATGIDSLGMAEAFFELEDGLQLTIPEPDLSGGSDFRTLRDVYDAIVSASRATA